MKKQIIELHKVGNFSWETLAYLTANGVEFPDAVAMIADALKLTAAQIAEMEGNY
jgi:hypothetical protein